MTDRIGPHFTLLDELDARQNDVIAELEVLNRRVELLLQEFSKPQPSDVPPAEKAA